MRFQVVHLLGVISSLNDINTIGETSNKLADCTYETWVVVLFTALPVTDSKNKYAYTAGVLRPQLSEQGWLTGDLVWPAPFALRQYEDKECRNGEECLQNLLCG